MISRLKTVSALLIAAACGCLIFSDITLGAYGTFHIPLHSQIGACYVLFLVAVLSARSVVAARWVLAFVAAQVLVTFITCYRLPRTLASVLEVVIPYIAVAQILVAGILLACVVRVERFGGGRHAA